MTEFIDTHSNLIIGTVFLIVFHLAAYIVLTLETRSRENKREFDRLRSADAQKLAEVYRNIWNKKNA